MGCASGGSGKRGSRKKLDYIHQNPVKCGLVETAEQWEFSSASWYDGGSSIIEIDDMEW